MSQDLKYFKYCEILLHLAVTTKVFLRFEIWQNLSKIQGLKRDLSTAKHKI